MCKFGKNRQGPQGPQGPIGVGAVSITNFFQGSIPINAATNVTVLTAAAATGNIIFNGYINFQTSTTPVVVTVIPVVNGIQITALTTTTTMAPAIGAFSDAVIPVSGFIPIGIGNSFVLNISATNYGLTDRLLLTSINYNIQ